MTTQIIRAVTVTIPNPTAAQMIAITELLEAAEQNETAGEAARTAKPKRSKPAKTVSDDEDEDFGTKPLKRKDLKDEEEEELEASDDGEAEESEDDAEGSDDDGEEEPGITYQEVRAALNRYGEKHPDQARAILLGFNIKSPKELSAKGNEKYWEPVYRKVMAKIKAAKKKK